jgi:hypothetical protein
MNTSLLCVLGLLSLGLVTLVAALLFGGPSPAPEMTSISDPFRLIRASSSWIFCCSGVSALLIRVVPVRSDCSC